MPADAAMGQLPLSLRLDPNASFDNFVVGNNADALHHVRAVVSGARPELIWLWGATGAGKTHLLSAVCRAISEAGGRAMYVDLATLPDTDMLQGLDDVDCLTLDNVERAAGRHEPEAALFRVLDHRVAGGGCLLMAADRSPRECPFLLPDLASRAGAASVYRLEPLADASLLTALKLHAASRGLDLDDAAAGYLLQRVSREMSELTAWLDRIDRFALAAQRRVTPALIRQVIAAALSE